MHTTQMETFQYLFISRVACACGLVQELIVFSHAEKISHWLLLCWGHTNGEMTLIIMMMGRLYEHFRSNNPIINGISR